MSVTLALDTTYRNLLSVNGEDHAGRMFCEIARAFVASGGWRRKYQGDGLAAFSSGTSDLFTANSGLGYATTGAWPAGVANSMSNRKAYVVLQEMVGGVATGREILLQRVDTAAGGQDRNVIMYGAWEPFTGVPNANTAPSAPAKSAGVGTINSATGVNIYNHLATSPQMGGAGGTIAVNIWTPTEPGGTTENVQAFIVEWADSLSDEPAGFFIYEALVDAAAADLHPCVFTVVSGSGTTWEAGEAIQALPPSHNSAGSTTTFRAVSAMDGSTITPCALLRLSGPDGRTFPSTGSATVVQQNVDAKSPIIPAFMLEAATTSAPQAFKGRCQNLEQHYPKGVDHLWPNLMFASVAHATERPRASMGWFLVPWEVGATRTGITTVNSTDLYRLAAPGEAPDETPPEIGTVSPAAASTIDPDEVITLPFSDDQTLAEVSVSATFSDLGYERTELVYAGGSYFAPYAGTDVGSDTALTLVFDRDPGFPGAVVFTWVAVDGSGNRATGAVSYGISSYLPSSTASP